MPEAKDDPGTGLDIARFLGDFPPVCPVLIHSSNTERVWSMHNELRFAGWAVDRVGPLGNDWIETSWLACVRQLLSNHSNTWNEDLPPDHEQRVERVQLSLDGLGLGDALGEMLSYRAHSAAKRIQENDLPAGPWFHTDDTEMAISIAGVLKAHGHIHQDALANGIRNLILEATLGQRGGNTTGTESRNRSGLNDFAHSFCREVFDVRSWHLHADMLLARTNILDVNFDRQTVARIGSFVLNFCHGGFSLCHNQILASDR